MSQIPEFVHIRAVEFVSWWECEEVLLICKYPNWNLCLLFISISPVCSPQLICTSPLTVNSVPFMPHFLDFDSTANVLVYSTMFPVELVSGSWHSLFLL